MNIDLRHAGVIRAVAPALGLTAWPLASLFDHGPLRFFHGPASTILPILISSTLAGLVSGYVRCGDDKLKAAPSFDGVSTRAGFRAALVAAAVLVMRANIASGQYGSITFQAVLVGFYAVVALLPATLFAMLAGGIGDAWQSSLRRDDGAGKPSFRFQPVHLLYAACALALLSPLVPGMFSPVRPPAPAPPATPPPVQVAQPVLEPVEPAPPPFRYEKPADLATSAASRFRVIASQQIEGISRDAPLLISPDGLKLAFPTEKKQLVVFDLESFSEIYRVQPPAALVHLAWAPDSKRLAGVFGEGEQRRIGIATIEGHDLVTLPQPKGVEIPEEAIAWPDPEEVLLYAQGKPPKPPLSVNLDTLEFRPVAEVPFFKVLDEPARASHLLPPTTSVPKSLRWSFEVAWAIQSASPQWVEGAYQFKTSGFPCVAVRDSGTGARTHLPELALTLKDRVVFAPDGSKVVVVRNAGAAIYYIGLGDAAPSTRRVEMHGKLGDLPEHQAIEKLLAEKSLFAFVYAPLINPLSQKVIGADRDQVQGIVRLSNWTGSQAEAVIVEEFKPIASDDIVCELHRWEQAHAKVIVAYDGTPWWSALGEPAADGDAPASGKPVPVPIDPVLTLQKDAYALTLQEIAQPVSPSPPVTRYVPPPPVVEAGSEGDLNEVDPHVRTLLDRFIRRHHAKSSNADVRSLMEDYAERVHHGKAGVVSKQVLAAEEAQYHAPGNQITERVRRAPAIYPINATRYGATYDVVFLFVKPDGTWTKGATEISLEIELTAAGPRIVKQSSTPREREKQRGRGVPPAI